jgi:hypothetical protein
MKQLLLLTVVLFSLNFPLFAQIVLITPDVTVDQDQVIDVDVKVNGFADILSLQFSMTWDPTVLEFIEIKDFDLPTTGGDLNFGTTNTFAGILSFAWIDPDLQGVDKSDNTAIFKVSFSAVGQPGDTTTVAIANAPAVIEAVNFQGEMTYTLDNGLVTINNPNATDEVASDDGKVSLYQNFPNPFSDKTQIKVDLFESSEVEFRIFNNFGQILYAFQNKMGVGTYNFTFDNSLFPTTGIYYYSLSTELDSVVKKLMFVK